MCLSILEIFSLKRCGFLVGFYIFPQPFMYIIFYIYITIDSILCFERPKVVKEMEISIRSNKNNSYKSINVWLDLQLQLENS